jgi:hypothetical protein
MSSPKTVLVPPPKHVRISPTGRPYVDTGELIQRQMERIERARQQQPNGGQQQSPPANNPNGRNGYGGQNPQS